MVNRFLIIVVEFALMSFFHAVRALDREVSDRCVELNVVASVERFEESLVPHERIVVECEDQIGLSFSVLGWMHISRVHCHQYGGLV